jgi:5-formyltetrahydrofolate cyclo-ligase
MHGAVLEESKSDLRRALLTRRKTHLPVECQAWSRSIQSQALRLPQYLGANAVALYSPIDNEVDTAAIALDALERKKRVFYPKIREGNDPAFLEISSLHELCPGRFGVFEPTGGAAIPREAFKNSVLFVPGVAFDRRGHRIGRGGGWYDRLLRSLARDAFFVGLAFEFQLIEGLVADQWDQRVHCIITEKRVIDCGLSAP